MQKKHLTTFFHDKKINKLGIAGNYFIFMIKVIYQEVTVSVFNGKKV